MFRLTAVALLCCILTSDTQADQFFVDLSGLAGRGHELRVTGTIDVDLMTDAVLRSDLTFFHHTDPGVQLPSNPDGSGVSFVVDMGMLFIESGSAVNSSYQWLARSGGNEYLLVFSEGLKKNDVGYEMQFDDGVFHVDRAAMTGGGSRLKVGTAVPEPGAWVLLVTGCAGVCMLLGRKFTPLDASPTGPCSAPKRRQTHAESVIASPELNEHRLPPSIHPLKTFTTCAISLLAIFNITARAEADTFGSGGNQFDIEFVTIGDPGNPADTTGNPNPAGAVDYVYRIGKYEVSRDMVEKASDAGGLGLTLDPMDSVAGGPRPAMPATGVSWNEAARFVNWLNEIEGFPAAYKFATQPGDGGYNANENILLWEPADAGYDADNLFRNSQAQYFLPSVHEWYKAAFYDPDANGGAGGYWNYPTGSDSEPDAVASGTAAGTAVWTQGGQGPGGPADITQAGGLSPYGVMGQAGNVWEWEETEWDLMNDNGSSVRGVRGGGWSSFDFSYSSRVSAFSRINDDPAFEFSLVGFRVASVPEPSTLLLVALGTLGLLLCRRSSSEAEKQYLFACKSLVECGRMLGGWLKHAFARRAQSRTKWLMKRHKHPFDRVVSAGNLLGAARGMIPSQLSTA